MDRKDRIVALAAVALVAVIGGFVIADEDHGLAGAYYYFYRATPASTTLPASSRFRTSFSTTTRPACPAAARWSIVRGGPRIHHEPRAVPGSGSQHISARTHVVEPSKGPPRSDPHCFPLHAADRRSIAMVDDQLPKMRLDSSELHPYALLHLSTGI